MTSSVRYVLNQIADEERHDGAIRVVRTPEGLVAHIHYPTGGWYARKHNDGRLSTSRGHKGPWIIAHELPLEVLNAFWKFEGSHP